MEKNELEICEINIEVPKEIEQFLVLYLLLDNKPFACFVSYEDK